MHYKTRQTWNEHNFGDQLPPDAEEINDKMFEEKVMPGSTKVRIDGIVRKDLGRKGEFIVYDYVLIGTDVNGRPLQRVEKATGKSQYFK